MKKVLGLFIVLVILAGAAFFFGWAQLPVPPGSYGVLRSKTHGLDPAVIREGEFRWVWQKLIPTNVTTLIFAPSPVSAPLALRGSLPLAETYAAAAGISADFSYNIEGDISFSIKPGSLPSLVLSRGIKDQADLEAYETSLARELGSFARERLEAYATGEQFSGDSPFGGDLRAISSRLEGELRGSFPNVENLSCAILSARMPDFALYAMARSLYGDYLARQKELLGTAMSVGAERSVNDLFRFDELEKYGELLTKYPILLDYLALRESGL
jgi:hypothetical protein